ncbi:hypothetical protein NLG97_g9570 [Lecanicillium saksenae]|uniref:Uncharacterized protein n=1 Tax=Lecanicillium saksenae TaxID=468837 RepID=A0ACC1QFM6_9HYPO|nr:hypothetical protein NLG97_g9570 [Lecanicillium saksenae]
MFLGVDVGITVLALAVVALRVGYRWRWSQLTVADHLITTAMVRKTNAPSVLDVTASLIHMVLDIVITASFGYGRHEKDLPEELRGSYKTLLMFWLIQIFTKLPLLFSKLSLTFVYRNLMHQVDHPLVKASRMLNYTLMIVLTGFFTSATLVSMFACQPIYKSWLPKTPGHCIDSKIMFNYVTSSVNILTSVCLICIPLPVLYLAKNKRIEVKQLTALVLFGIIDTIISIVRLYMITDLYRVNKDFTWLIIPTHLMIVVEMNVTIIAASLVVMRPCFQAIFDLAFPHSQYSSHNRSVWSSKNRSRRSEGYIRSGDESNPSNAKGSFGVNGPALSHDSEGGIVKTVNIELASNPVGSEENILKGKYFY